MQSIGYKDYEQKSSTDLHESYESAWDHMNGVLERRAALEAVDTVPKQTTETLIKTKK